MAAILLSASVSACLALSVVDGDPIKCSGQNMCVLGPGSPNKSAVDAPDDDLRVVFSGTYRIFFASQLRDKEG